MKRCTSTIAMATPTAPITNIHRQPTWSTIKPESTRPKPPPMPNTAESRPIPTFIRSGGNSSRMIPKLNGNTAPAAPETILKAISVQMSGAAAQPMQPTRNGTRETTSRRSLPNRSPSLPRIGVSTAAERRKPVRTQVTQVVDASSSRWSSGRAGTTIVCCRACGRRRHRQDGEREAVVLALLRHVVTQRNDPGPWTQGLSSSRATAAFNAFRRGVQPRR